MIAAHFDISLINAQGQPIVVRMNGAQCLD
jgi:hypothetical protein